MSENSKQCPLCNVERRLDDALVLWKEAESSYFIPDKFRIKVNACIQALRSVTFVLQKNQTVIKDFEKWYENWRNLMRGNKVLRWLIDARNQIEKQGDLDAASTARISLHTSWFKPAIIEFAVPPKMKPSELAMTMTKTVPKCLISEESLLRVERCWREVSLPEIEILDALRITYRELARILVDAHLNLIDSSGTCNVLTNLKEHILSFPPVMQNHSSQRFIWVKLSDTEVFTVKSLKPKMGSLKKMEQEVRERYGVNNIRSAGTTLEDRVRYFFELGKMMLVKDGYHIFMALIFTGNTGEIHELRVPDRASKHAMIRHLADRAHELKASQVILINEVWTATVKLGDSLIHAADAPNRGEAFVAEGVDSTGKGFHLSVTFERKNEKIVLGEALDMGTEISNIMSPILEAIRT